MSFDSHLYRAVSFAASIHDGQKKKGTGEPFIAHVFGVAMRLLKEGADDDVVIAGLLHDALEKTDATIQDIAAEFGDRVARIVEACTEDESLSSWIERKEKLLTAMREAPPDAQMVMIADKLHNITAFLKLYREIGDDIWTLHEEGRIIRLRYFAGIREIAEAEERLGPPHSLFREYIQLHNDVLTEMRNG